MCSVTPSNRKNTTQLRKAAKNNSPVVIHWPVFSPISFQPKPQISAPTNGAKRMIVSMILALHNVDIFNRDRASIAAEIEKNGKTDCSLGGGHGKNKQRENLPYQIAQII